MPLDPVQKSVLNHSPKDVPGNADTNTNSNQPVEPGGGFGLLSLVKGIVAGTFEVVAHVSKGFLPGRIGPCHVDGFLTSRHDVWGADAIKAGYGRDPFAPAPGQLKNFP